MADRREEILWLKPQPTPTSVTIRGAKEAMDEYSKEWGKKYQEANQFICDLGKLIGLDGLGYDDMKASIEDFRDAIDEKKKEMCLALLEYMATKGITCRLSEWDDGRIRHIFYNKGEILSKEQLFENFL
jgi:hypothetical protein